MMISNLSIRLGHLAEALVLCAVLGGCMRSSFPEDATSLGIYNYSYCLGALRSVPEAGQEDRAYVNEIVRNCYALASSGLKLEATPRPVGSSLAPPPQVASKEASPEPLAFRCDVTLEVTLQKSATFGVKCPNLLPSARATLRAAGLKGAKWSITAGEAVVQADGTTDTVEVDIQPVSARGDGTAKLAFLGCVGQCPAPATVSISIVQSGSGQIPERAAPAVSTRTPSEPDLPHRGGK